MEAAPEALTHCALAALLALVPLPAAAERCYAVQAASSKVSFRVEQAGSPFQGAFREFGGTVCLERGAVARIDVWLDPGSVDSGLPELDAALKGGEFFAIDKYPRVTFASTSVEARDRDELARGPLEIKGTRREVAVPFRLERAASKPVVSGSFSLNRLNYGIGTGEWTNTKWLGAEVKVEFRAALSGP